MLLLLLLLCADATTAFAPRDKAALNAAVLEWVRGTTPGRYGGQDIAQWDVSGVNDMSDLFCVSGHFDVCDYSKENFNGDLSKWNVAQVTNMGCV